PTRRSSDLRRREARHAEARGDTDVVRPAFDLRRGERRPDALREVGAAIEVRVGEEDRELLAAQPDGEVDVANSRAENVGERTQRLVPRLVAVAVVHLLEVVEVREHER